jgi:hypothetical protein
MARKVDPVPDLYAKAFSSIGEVRARLRALRERVTAPPACESHEVQACDGETVDASEAVTAECVPPRERLSTLNEFRAVLANMRSIVF